jgi:hypothetical protein
VCSHAEREDIEQSFVDWESTARLAEKYSLGLDSIYRHARALGLMEKRRHNLRHALERLIEKVGEVDVNAAAVVSAISACAKINSRGEWVERTETVNLNALFDRMSEEELERYATEGAVPSWFLAATGATQSSSDGEADD